MCLCALLALILTSVAVLAGAHKDKKVTLQKCCGENEMLAADGTRCVEAPWSGNYSFHINELGEVGPPLNSDWVRRWLPPGLPLHNIVAVACNMSHVNDLVISVNSSFLGDPALNGSEVCSKNKIQFVGKEYIMRPKPGGGYRVAFYCVDAAPPPLGPFAMQFRTFCNKEECVNKCCIKGELMKNIEGHWKCEEDPQGFWSPNTSSLTVFDPEFPYHDGWANINGFRLWPFVDQYVHRAPKKRGPLHLSFSTWNICFDFYGSSNSSKEGLFYQEYPRISRGVYWLLRPLCILSALLLMTSLLSITSDKNMRRKLHGRCLACHAASLFAFNIGQIAYYIAISDQLDDKEKPFIPKELSSVCKHFGKYILNKLY